jgi:hypothetical protein
MDPSTTMKFLFPFVFVPVTVHAITAELATMDLPGSMTRVNPSEDTKSRTVSIRSIGVGSVSPLHNSNNNGQQKHD